MNRATRLSLAVFFSVLCVGCSSVFYFPDRRELVYRHKLPISPQDVEFTSEDGVQLHGWYFPALTATGPKAVIVQFHGNGENLTSHFISLYEGPARGYAYFAFDYRGYGRSKDRTTPAGTVQDGVAAIRWLHARHPDKPLIVVGQSLGGAVAFRAIAQLKNEIPIVLVVADSTFPDYRSVARAMAARSWLTYPLQPLAWLLVDNSQSPKHDIAKVSPIPLIVMHGTADRVVPVSMGQEVFRLAQEPKELWLIPKGQHLDAMVREGGLYGDRLFNRMDQILRDQNP